jgi:hypothetical protein
MNLWHAWDATRAKELLIRDERSDILPIDTAQAMQQRGPGCKLVTIPNVGHAPHLNTEHQISIVSEFLPVDAAAEAAGTTMCSSREHNEVYTSEKRRGLTRHRQEEGPQALYAG